MSMVALPATLGKNKSDPANPNRDHNPLICGLDYATDCPACRGAADREAEADFFPMDRVRQQWDALREQYHRLIVGPEDRPWEPPESFSPAELGRLVWTLMQPSARDLLLAVLGDLVRVILAEDLPAALGVLLARRAL